MKPAIYGIATIPPYWGWSAYTPVIPKLYWNVYSQEERIKRLCLEYDKLTHYASMLAEEVNNLSADVEQKLAEFTEKINAQLEAQNQAIQEQLEAQNLKVDAQLLEIREYIDRKFADIAEGVMTWDVTTGTYRPSKEVMRRLYQALATNHKGDEGLVIWNTANKTVAQMAQESVYHVAWGEQENIVIDDQIPTTY